MLNVTWPRSLSLSIALLASGCSGSLFPILNRDCVSRGDRGGRDGDDDDRSYVCTCVLRTDLAFDCHLTATGCSCCCRKGLMLISRFRFRVRLAARSSIYPASTEESSLARSLAHPSLVTLCFPSPLHKMRAEHGTHPPASLVCTLHCVAQYMLRAARARRDCPPRLYAFLGARCSSCTM